ncbi:MAG: transposase, partial [Acidobacteriota bacterium]
MRDYDQAVLGQECTPGAIVAIQTYGDELNWHPHLHSLVSDAVWDRQGNPHPLPLMDSETLARLFQEHVLRMLVSKRQRTREFAQRLRSWRHSGFQVYCGRPVHREDEEALERLSASILRPSFAGTRLHYHAQQGPVRYRTGKGLTRSMDALDWIARVTSHIPNRPEQRVRYYGWFSNASRGKRRRQGVSVAVQGEQQGAAQPDSATEEFVRERRRSW